MTLQTLFKTIVIIALLLTTLSRIQPSLQAQTVIELESLSIEVWPEFDRPETLVIYRGRLAPTVPLPVDLTFRLPEYVTAMNAVAVLNPQNVLVNHPYELEAATGANLLQFTAEGLSFQFEYYDPQILTRNGDERRLDFATLADYPAANLILEVQQPAGASDLTLSPPPDDTQSRADQLTYHLFSYSAVAAGQPITVEGSYRNESGTLTAAFQVEPAPAGSAPLGLGGTAAQEGPAPAMIIGYVVIGIGAVVLIAAGGMWYNTRRRTDSIRQPASAGQKGSARFCPQCGAPFRPKAGFCHQCGAPRPRN